GAPPPPMFHVKQNKNTFSRRMAPKKRDFHFHFQPPRWIVAFFFARCDCWIVELRFLAQILNCKSPKYSRNDGGRARRRASRPLNQKLPATLLPGEICRWTIPC